jgi:hypothetical protein
MSTTIRILMALVPLALVAVVIALTHKHSK